MTTPEQKEQLRRDVFAEVFDMLRHVASREPHRESLDTKAHRLTDAIMKHAVGALEPASVAPDRPALEALIAEARTRIESLVDRGAQVCPQFEPWEQFSVSCKHCGYQSDVHLLKRMLIALTATGRAPEGETPAPDATTPGTEP